MYKYKIRYTYLLYLLVPQLSTFFFFFFYLVYRQILCNNFLFLPMFRPAGYHKMF